jgi:tripartite-type tricarboxylate transporter receptor subunit TctC
MEETMSHTSFRRRSLLAALAAVAALASVGDAMAQTWPNRPITMIVPWGAGGGTDATARMIASLLEKQLGVPVPVVNRTGGSGVVGHQAIASAEPDGYTIGIATLEIGGMHHQGLTALTHEAYEPIGLYNSDPAALFVRADAPYKTAKDLVDAVAKSTDRQFKASGSAQGGVNHLALAGLLKAAGIPTSRVAWVPSEGAAPGLQDLAAGGVQIATASLPEAAALMAAGRIRPLAIFAPKRDTAAPDVPTFVEATGLAWSIGSWRGIVAPKGTPAAVVQRLQAEVGKVVENPEYLTFMKSKGYATGWTPGDGFRSFMVANDKGLGETLAEVGLKK